MLVKRGQAYQLAIVRDGRRRMLGVPASSEPFVADVGPDSTGAPAVVLRHCPGDDPARCRIFIHWLDARGAVPVRTTEERGPEGAAALWRGRIVWSAGERVLSRSRLVRQSAPRDELLAVKTGATVETIDLRTPHYVVQSSLPDAEFTGSEIRAGQREKVVPWSVSRAWGGVPPHPTAVPDASRNEPSQLWTGR